MTTITCKYCSREVGVKQLNRHYQSKICLKSQNKTSLSTKCSKCDKYLTPDGHRKHVCKNASNNINDLVDIVERLKKTCVPTNITIDNSIDNSINNSVNIQNLNINISSELFKTNSNKIDYQDYVKGGIAVADKALQSIPYGLIITTDVTRKQIKYKGPTGKMIDDPRGQTLLTMICQGIQESAAKTITTAGKQLSFTKINSKNLNKAKSNVADIKQGAKGDDTTQFAKDLTRRIAQQTDIKKPQNINIAVVPLSQLDDLPIDLDNEVTYDDFCCSPMSTSSLTTDTLEQILNYHYDQIHYLRAYIKNRKSKKVENTTVNDPYYDSDDSLCSDSSSLNSFEREDIDGMRKMNESKIEVAKCLRSEYRNIKHKDIHPQCYKHANSYDE